MNGLVRIDEEVSLSSSRKLLGLIGLSTLLRLVWSTSLGLGNDEAYHYLFPFRTDWSYVDHPPMLAVIEALGLMCTGGWVYPISLRLGFIALFAGSTWLMARLTTRLYGEQAGLLAAFALNITPYYSVAAGSFALPDGPFLFFWLLTMNALVLAFEQPNEPTAWAWVGLAWGAAMLSKYLAVFVPMGVLLYFVLCPRHRNCLWNRGPYLAFAIGVLLFSPVLWWNWRHGWVSFAFQGGRALGGTRLRPDAFFLAIGGQILYLSPWIWFALVAVLGRQRHRLFGNANASARFLLCQAVPPLLLFSLVSCTRPVLPHWSLVAFLPLFPFLGMTWAEKLRDETSGLRGRLRLGAVITAALVSLVLIQARSGVIPIPHDPTHDFYGWDQVATELKRRGILDPSRQEFLFTSRWYYSGQLSFATRDSKPILCYNARHAQGFAYWSSPEEWVGRDGIYVGVNDCSAEVDYFAQWFKSAETLGDFTVFRGGRPIRRIHLYRFISQTKPFPFGNSPRPRKSRLPVESVSTPPGLVHDSSPQFPRGKTSPAQAQWSGGRR